MSVRQNLIGWLESAYVRNGILAVILFNAVILGLETSASVMERFGPLLRGLDAICLAIFVAEIVAKLFAYGPRFFRNGWNLFDFVIVGIALLPVGEGVAPGRQGDVGGLPGIRLGGDPRQLGRVFRSGRERDLT